MTGSKEHSGAFRDRGLLSVGLAWTILVLTFASMTGVLPGPSMAAPGDPIVRIVSPLNGTIVYGGDASLILEVDDFILNGSAMGGPNVSGEGHYIIFIDDVEVQAGYNLTVPIGQALEGSRSVKVELVNNDGSPLIPPVYAEVDLFFAAVMPDARFLYPKEDAVVYGPSMDLRLELVNFSMNESAAGGSNAPYEGHCRLYVDQALRGELFDDTTVVSGLGAGTHELVLELVNNDNSSLEPAVRRTVNITVSLSVPSISIEEPWDDLVAYGGEVTLRLALINFTLDPGAVGMENQAGVGHYHLYVDGALQGIFTETERKLNGLPEGGHSIKVELRNNDHSVLSPPISDTVTFHVVEDVPTLSVLFPYDGALVYDDEVAVSVEVTDLELRADAIGSSNMPGQGHYHLILDGGTPQCGANVTLALSGTSAGEHELTVELRNNDHSELYPPVIDTVFFGTVAAAPSLEVLLPEEGAIYYDVEVEVQVSLTDFSLNASAAGGPNSPREGHYEMSLDGVPSMQMDQLTFSLHDLFAGRHALRMELRNNDRSPLMPPVSDEVSFYVVETLPQISITSPDEGSVHYGTEVELVIEVADFELNGSALGNPNMPGQGHYDVHLDGSPLGPGSSPTFFLTGLSAGVHQVVVELLNNDGSRLIPRVTAELEIWNIPVPSIEIIAPEDGVVVYGTSLELEVEIHDFILDSAPFGKANVPGEGHFNVYLDDELKGPFYEEQVTLTGLQPGDFNLRVALVNKDHSPLPVIAMDIIRVWVKADRFTLEFGPVLSDGGPVEDAMVRLELEGSIYSANTDSDGVARFLLPYTWLGKEVDFTITSADHETLEGKASIGIDGSLNPEDGLSLVAVDDGDWDIFLILAVMVALIVLAVILYAMWSRKKKEAPMEE